MLNLFNNIILYDYFVIFVKSNITIMEDNFDDYAISIENDVLSNDFDDIDLYGDKIVEEDTDNFGEEIKFE